MGNAQAAELPAVLQAWCSRNCGCAPSILRTASSASRMSSYSMKAKPGGLRAIQTLRSGPYLSGKAETWEVLKEDNEMRKRHNFACSFIAAIVDQVAKGSHQSHRADPALWQRLQVAHESHSML